MRDSSNNVYYREYVEATEAASLNYSYAWGLKLGTSQTTITQNTETHSLPEIYLAPGCQLVIGVNGIQAADQFSLVNLSYEQWFSF